MKLNIYTDKNLGKYLLQGWNEEKLISGKIKTLTGKMFHLDDVNEKATILEIKQKIEDLEGIPVDKQELR